MKKILFAIILTCLTSSIFAQSFEEFYEHDFGLYSPMSYISAKSHSLDSLGIKNKNHTWGLINLEFTIANANSWGLSAWVKQRQIGDLFSVLRGLLSKKPHSQFNRDMYLSDFGLLPNLRFGLNVIAKDRTIVNVGLVNNYYIYELQARKDGQYVQTKNDWMCAGPHIYVDQILTDWLAIRVGTAPQVNYGRGTKQDFKPRIWEHNIELFSTIGFYFGVDILSVSKIKDDFNLNNKMRRIDFKLGYKFKL